MADNYLSNTPWQISTGTWKVSTEVIGTVRCKVIECVTAGILYMPVEKMNQSKTEAAYGKWEFWLYKGADGNHFNIQLIGDMIGGYEGSGQDGYNFYISATEDIVITRSDNGSRATYPMYTSASYVLNTTWYKFTITRTSAGIFTVWMNDILIDVSGGGGTNPSAADTTHTTANYICLDLDAGDKLVWSSEDGSMDFFKGLFA